MLTIRAVVMLSLIGLLVAPVRAESTARRVSHTYVQTLVAAPDKVFPLLGPIDEALWADGWAPEMVYPADGSTVEGSVFLTRRGDEETIWILTEWDRATRRVEYVHVTPGSDVTTITIRLGDTPDGGTRAEVTYTWTSVSEKGNAVVEFHTKERFEQSMKAWEDALNHYLKTGRRLSHR